MASRIDQASATLWARLQLDERKVGRELAQFERLNPSTGHGGTGAVGVLIRQAEHLGLGDLFADAKSWFARADAVSAELHVVRNTLERDRQAAILALADGKTSIAEIVKAAPSYRAVQKNGPASTLAAAAIVEVRGRAEAAAMQAVDVLWRKLVGKCAGQVQESVRLAELIAGVDSDQEALQASESVRDAWTQARKAVDTFVACHDLAGHLRDPLGCIAGPAGRSDRYEATPYSWLRYRDPDKVPKNWRELPPQRRLHAAVMAGAGPGLYTAEDADRRWQAREERRWQARDERLLAKGGRW